MTSLATIARNTAFSALGDLLSKIASLAFFVVLARQLGAEAFGHYMFGLSVTVLLTSFAGFGTEPLLTRAVAREHDKVHGLFWTSLALKAGLGVALSGVAVLISVLNGYPAAVHATVALLGLGCVVESMSKTVAATFLAHDETLASAKGLLLQRFSTALLGIAAVVAGAHVVPVAAIFLGGAVLGFAYVFGAMHRHGIHPRREVSLARARTVAAEAAPFGFKLIFSTALFRIDATLLSLMKGGAAVGLYSAAYRALESTLFVPYAFEAAVYPTMSRLGRTTTPSIASIFEGGLKAIVVLMAPIGLLFLLYGGEVLELLYGGEYTAAEDAMQWLGGAAALYGVSLLAASLISAQGRIKTVAWVTGAILLLNVALNLIVIPRWSLTGAAAVTTITELIQTVVMLGIALRISGRVSARRILAGPLTGLLALTAVALAAPRTLPVAALAMAAYVLAAVLVERALYPSDLARFTGALRSRFGRS